jgi:DNA-binding HxlR family transcriptional regulator
MFKAIQKVFDLECPNRHILDQIADKWSVLILAVLFRNPMRFNALKRRLNGITQKSLTDALRRLERNGIVARRVITGSPIAVEYSVTPLGLTLGEPFAALYRWTIEHHEDVNTAQVLFDARPEPT